MGNIVGTLSVPAAYDRDPAGLPAQAIYAISVDGRRFYRAESVANQPWYSILDVTPGDYHVYSTVRPVPRGVRNFRFAHASAIHVKADATTAAVDIDAWYENGPEIYPVIPKEEVSAISPAPPSFASAVMAASSIGEATIHGRHVESQKDCPVNIACFWFLLDNNGGVNAEYFEALAGSNGDLIRCVIYAVHDNSYWRPFDVRCPFDTGGTKRDEIGSAFGSFFPAVGRDGHVQLNSEETGCVRVHSSPALTAPVAECLENGTHVHIISGPYFAPTKASKAPNRPSSLDIWWDIEGRGWMVHQYLYADY